VISADEFKRRLRDECMPKEVPNVGPLVTQALKRRRLARVLRFGLSGLAVAGGVLLYFPTAHAISGRQHQNPQFAASLGPSDFCQGSDLTLQQVGGVAESGTDFTSRTIVTISALRPCLLNTPPVLETTSFSGSWVAVPQEPYAGGGGFVGQKSGPVDWVGNGNLPVAISISWHLNQSDFRDGNPPVCVARPLRLRIGSAVVQIDSWCDDDAAGMTSPYYYTPITSRNGAVVPASTP
jgi:hypothetical protein